MKCIRPAFYSMLSPRATSFFWRGKRDVLQAPVLIRRIHRSFLLHCLAAPGRVVCAGFNLFQGLIQRGCACGTRKVVAAEASSTAAKHSHTRRPFRHPSRSILPRPTIRHRSALLLYIRSVSLRLPAVAGAADDHVLGRDDLKCEEERR